MSDRFKGKVALVTGSGQSIGRAIARLLAQEGARVVVNSRSEKSADATPTAADTAREIRDEGGEALVVFADVSKMDGARSAVDAAVQSYGALDILVNNAGAGYSMAGIGELGEDDWDATLAGNLKSQYACTHFAVPRMKRQGAGRILNIGSPIGLFGMAQKAAYCAAKGGVMGLTFALAHELAGTGITVNCLLPSAATERTDRMHAARAAEGRVAARTPNRIPEAIAAPAAQLVSDAAAQISGQVFLVAGGQIKHFAWPPSDKSLYKRGTWTLDELAPVFAAYFGARLEPAKPPPYMD